MKICFIGLGSIGSRHIMNLSFVLKNRNIKYSIDALRSKKIPIPENISNLINNEYFNINELQDDYDIIFITNPTFLHYDTISRVVNNTKHMFIEKPIFETNKYNIEELHMRPDGIYYVACPLRYSPVIKYLKDSIETEKIYSVRAISSSYLPNWRKGIDYRNVYSAKKSQGGGVSLDLIHEWDYITYLFGNPLQVYNMNGQFSSLEIDSDDISIYIAKYRDKFIELHLDYFGRNTIRQLELYSDDYVIYADLIRMKIEYKGIIQKAIQFKKEDIYLNEMNCFIGMILNKAVNENSIYNAIDVLEIATCDIFNHHTDKNSM